MASRPRVSGTYVQFLIRFVSKITTIRRAFGVLLTGLIALLSSCTQPPVVVAPTAYAVGSWEVETIVRTLSIDELAGQLLMIGIENDAEGKPLLALDDATTALMHDVRPGAAVLFGQVFDSVDQVRALVNALEANSSIPPIIATDHEGGYVARLNHGTISATPIPSAAIVGRAVAAEGGVATAGSLGAVMGGELRSLGITMDFAPVADVDPPNEKGVMGRDERSFGNDPALVGATAAEIARGLQAAGVAAVLKHFPGHGSVLEDSHDRLVVVTSPEADYRARDIAAFAPGIRGGAIGVMTGHIAVPSISGDETPASLSPAITRLLRDDLGFSGLIITDAINMRALTSLAPEPELVVRAVEAGADMILKPLDPAAARDAIVNAVESGRLTRARLEESVRRIFTVKQRLGMLGPLWSIVADPVIVDRTSDDAIGSTYHRAVAEVIRERGGTE